MGMHEITRGEAEVMRSESRDLLAGEEEPVKGAGQQLGVRNLGQKNKVGSSICRS